MVSVAAAPLGALIDFDQLRAQLPTGLVEVEWPSLRVTYMNAIARTILGYDSEDIAAGLSGLALLDAPSQQRMIEIAAEQMRDTVALGLPYERQKGQQVFEFTGVRKDGTHFPVDVQSAYILDRAGFPVGVRFLFRDLTEQRKQESEKRQLDIQARQSQKLDAIGELAGGMAHELNNLFTALLGNLHMLAAEVRDRPEAVELVDEADTAAQRGAHLISRLLQFARPEVERHEPVDLARLIHETIAFVRPSLAPGTKLTAGPLPSRMLVSGNPDAIQQVLVNLLVNARDAISEGDAISITATTEHLEQPTRWLAPDLPGGDYHVIRVTDTGRGIPPEIQERIFDLFFSTRPFSAGRGLGLPVGLGIARSHGGWIAVESTFGAGTTFRVALPAVNTREVEP